MSLQGCPIFVMVAPESYNRREEQHRSSRSPWSHPRSHYKRSSLSPPPKRLHKSDSTRMKRRSPQSPWSPKLFCKDEDTEVATQQGSNQEQQDPGRSSLTNDRLANSLRFLLAGRGSPSAIWEESLTSICSFLALWEAEADPE